MLILGPSSPTCKDSCDGTFIALIDGGNTTGQLDCYWLDLGMIDPPAASGDFYKMMIYALVSISYCKMKMVVL